MKLVYPLRSSFCHPERPTLGILTGELNHVQTIHNFVDPLFHGMRSAAQDYDCNLLIGWGVEHSLDVAYMAWPKLSAETDFVPIGPWNTDGLLILGSFSSPARLADLQQLQATGHPLLFVSNQQNSPTIKPDNEGGIRQALLHLKEHGHRRIAFIAGVPGNIINDTSERLLAYQTVMHEQGLEIDPQLIVYGFHGISGGYQAMQSLLAGGAKFTAVLCSNDDSASGAMRALHQAGRQIPKDIAIIGFDDKLTSVAESPPLTTIHYPLFETGYRALERLFNYITGQTPTLETLRIPTWLVVRNSCGCQPGKPLPLLPKAYAINTHPTGESETLGPVPNPTDRPINSPSDVGPIQILIEVAQAEIQTSNSNEISVICRRLVDSLKARLRETVEEPPQLADSLQHVETVEDDPYVWQATLLTLYRRLSFILQARMEQTDPTLVSEHSIREVQAAINESVWRQYNRYVIQQRLLADEVGLLTSRLLSVLDEQQILQKLAEHLPRLGIDQVQLAHFEPGEAGPVACYRLSAVLAPSHLTECLFASEIFPPTELYPSSEPFYLALVPLVAQGKTAGFVVFDAHHLGACSIIAQQLATALKSAQLYQQATHAHQVAEEARQLAEEANRLKSRFLSTVSHELRTPLNLIVGLSEMLIREQVEGELSLALSYQDDLERIHLSAQHLDWLIRDVLDLASNEAGQLQLAGEPLDLAEGLAAVIEIGAQLAKDKGLTWHVDIPEALPRVWADRIRLRQVVLNLVNNAVKFTTQGQITLKIEPGQKQITLRVSDTGLGIPLAEQPFIFNEFRQSERTAARGYGGLGLGLAICRRLVELHGGQIGVSSSGDEGQGSTFYFTLPVMEDHAGAATYPAIEFSVPRPHRVLILGKRESTSKQLSDHLNQRGFETCLQIVEPTSNWLPHVLTAAPGAIVLDFMLASERGWEILKTLKEHPSTQSLPVLFFGLAPDENTGAVLEMDYLVKPIRHADLGRTLAQQGWPKDGETQKTILIVDDEPAILDMHARMVKSYSPSHNILKARDGWEALKVMRDNPPDLVLLDLMMPGLDGFGVLEAMQQSEIPRSIPVIVLTARILNESDMVRLNRGVVTVLGKGMFTLKETLTHIEAALKHDAPLGNTPQRVVRQAMGYLHTHYAEALSREAIARYVGVSERYLTRCFRHETGLTLITYLNRYRINQAKVLLVNNRRQSVTETAIAVGFSNVAYFSRVFQREVGLWPGEYQRHQTPQAMHGNLRSKVKKNQHANKSSHN